MAGNSSSSSLNQVLPATTSTCLTQSITGTHNFVITNFSLLDGRGIGQYVSSGSFSVGGCYWRLHFYPDGENGNDAGYASIFLNFLDGPEDTCAKFSISLFDKDDQALRRRRKKKRKGSIVSRDLAYTFGHDGRQDWGITRFIEKSLLQELLPLSNDCFTIRCVLTVVKTRTEDAATIVVPPSSLHLDFAHMFKDAEGADVTIKVGDQFFLAHKHVLAARSRVFKARLFGVMKENPAECIQIDDMEPCVFDKLLYFIYTDSLPENFEGNKNVAMQHLLVAADLYGLRLMCEEKLCSWIDVETVATTLVLAEQHQRVQLKEACLGFLAWRDVLGSVLKTEGFKHLTDSCPMIMKEILDKIASAKNE